MSPTAPALRSDALGSLIIAALSAAALVWLVPTALGLAAGLRGAQGEVGLTLALATAAASGAAVICAWLMVVRTLAAIALLVGPASTTGRAVLMGLRLLAPRLARRTALIAAAASILPGLAMGTAQADSPSTAAPGLSRSATPAHLEAGLPLPALPAPGLEGADDHGDDSTVPTADPTADPGELPGLGWGEASSPSADDPAAAPSTGASTDGRSAQGTSADERSTDEESAEPASAAPAARRAGRSAADDTSSAARASSGSPSARESSAAPDRDDRAAPEVVVRRGDSLWSITDRQLGPGRDPAAEIAAAWPALYEANADVIGSDPDHIEPGQHLRLPASLRDR